MKIFILVILCLVTCSAFAHRDDATCANPKKLANARLGKGWVKQKLIENRISTASVGITHCDAFWAEKVLGLAYPKIMTFPECAVGVGFESKEAMHTAARAIGSYVAIEGGQSVRICGGVVGEIKALGLLAK